MAETGITTHEPLNDEERERYEELREHFDSIRSISERAADSDYKEYLDLDMRAIMEQPCEGVALDPNLFAHNGSGYPLYFKSVDMKKGTVAGYDHGVMAEYLCADPETRVCKVDGTLAVWDGRHYRRTDAPILSRIIDLTHRVGYTCDVEDEYSNIVTKRFRYSTNERQRKETLSYLDLIAEDHEGLPAQFIDFTNGRLDVYAYRDGDPDAFDTEPDPHTYSTNVIPHDWNPDASCPELDAMLDNIACHRPEVRATLEEVPGSILWRDPFRLQQCNFTALIGEGGCGKTTYFKTIEYAVGLENVADVKIHDLGEKFIPKLEELPNALCILDEEVSSDYIRGLAVDRIKTMTTGGRPTLDRKGISGVTYRNMATIVVATNTMFDMSSKDINSALEDRLTFIPMDMRFRGTDQQDVDILDKICTESGAERFLFLAVQGLLRLLENKHFTISAEDERRKQEMRAQNNTMEAWLLDMEYDAARFTTWNPDDHGSGEPAPMLKSGDQKVTWDQRENPYDEYAEWCAANGHGRGRYTQIKFSNFMCRRFGLKRGESTYSAELGKNYRPYIAGGE